MQELVGKRFIEDIKFIKSKVLEMDKELHRLSRDFSDSILSRDEFLALEKARKEYKEGKTKSLEQIRKELKL